jgi:predicted nucleic acid-binding protein
MIILDTNVISERLRPEPTSQIDRWLATRNTSDNEGCGIELIDPWTFSEHR